VAAAQVPAGPAPMMTGGLSSIVSGAPGDDPHALGREARAGAQSRAVVESDPAILAGAHQAEPGARPVAEFALPHSLSIGQQGGQQRVARQRLARASVDDETNDRPIALGQAMELRINHILDRHHASFETRPAAAPQDEGDLSMPSMIYLILRRSRSGRLEGRTPLVQYIKTCPRGGN
jgi:hypothetical protein